MLNGIRYWALLLFSLLAGFVALGQKHITGFSELLSTASTDSMRMAKYTEIYNRFRYSNPDSCYHFLEDGLKYFQNKNYVKGVARISLYLGTQDATNGNLNLARKRQTGSLELFTSIGDYIGMGMAHNYLGVLEGKSGQYDKATQHFFKALELSEKTGNYARVNDTYLNLGLVNYYNGNTDKAEMYYKKALEYTRDSNDIRGFTNVYNNLGILYGKKGDLKSSLTYFNKALEKCKSKDYIDVYLYALLNIGIVYQKSGDNKTALQKLNEALEIAVDKKLPEERARITLNIATIHAETQPQIALQELDTALSVAIQLGNKSFQIEIYEAMIELEKRLGRLPEVIKHLEKKQALSDSLFNSDKAKDMANLEAVFELEQSNSEIRQLNLQAEANLQKRNMMQIAIVSLIIAVIVILILYRNRIKFNKLVSQQRAELQASNSIKDRLFSVIGHDLRGPIGTIIMILENLDDPGIGPEERAYIKQTLLIQSQSTLDTLDTLLYWGQSQIKGVDVRQQDFDTKPQIRRNINLLENVAKLKEIQLKNTINSEIRVHADPDHFNFIIRNLISNAIKYTKQGGAVTVAAEKGNGSEVVFSVADTGIGIDKNSVHRIFKPDMESTRGTADEKGTGIGLMLCKEFVEKNGGRIWVESEVGVGSTFFFSLKSA